MALRARSAAWLVPALLATAGALLVVLGTGAGPGGGAGGTPLDDVAPAHAGTSGDPSHADAVPAPDALPPATPLLAADETGAPLPDLPDGVLAVRVLAAEGRVPLERARVRLLAETAESAELGWASLAAPVEGGEASTDHEGRARLPWGDVEGPRRLVAEGVGRRPGERRVAAAPHGEVVLLLDAGLALAGRVVDRGGSAVSGVEVDVRAVRRPRLPAPADDVPVPGAERARATSGPDGRFEAVGLSPGTYVVATADGEWVAVTDLPASTVEPRPGATGVRAAAGARDVVLVVERRAHVALRLVDARTREPIDATWSAATLVAEGAPAAAWTSYAARGAPDGAERSPARLHARLAGGGPPGDVEVAVRAGGYRSARARVPVLGAVPADAAGWTEVALEPEHAGDGCRLVVDTARALAGEHRPATRIATVCLVADGMRVYRTGRSVGGDRHEFRDLPVGEAVVEVWDGLSRSRPFAVRLAPGTGMSARAEFGPPEGAAFRLEDGGGRRVFDADVLVVAREGQERGLPDRSDATRLERGRRVVVPLEPGRYRYAVHKEGVGYDAGSFTVAAGAVTDVRARLGPLRRFEAAGAGRAAAPAPSRGIR